MYAYIDGHHYDTESAEYINEINASDAISTIYEGNSEFPFFTHHLIPNTGEEWIVPMTEESGQEFLAECRAMEGIRLHE